MVFPSRLIFREAYFPKFCLLPAIFPPHIILGLGPFKIGPGFH
jgi:hypothetical protein